MIPGGLSHEHDETMLRLASGSGSFETMRIPVDVILERCHWS
jgi:hypothetical protein